jgi:hypothetical protein
MENPSQNSKTSSGKPLLQYTLKQLLLLTVLIAAFAAITVEFGQYALSALPLTFAGGGVLLILHGLSAIRLTLLKFGFLMAVWYFLVTLGTVGCVDPSGPVRASQCRFNLKQIAVALYNYHEAYGTFPPAHVADENGRPTHSWRVLILPFIEQQALYDQYDFREPWNGPNNRQLATVRVPLYGCPEEDPLSTSTSYVAVLGPETVWPGSQSTKVSDVVDGTANTLMVVEVANSGIHWMEPRDLELSSMAFRVNPRQGRGISSYHPHDKWGRPAHLSANVVLVDGTAHALWNTISPPQLRALLTIAGHEPVDLSPYDW